MSNPAITAMSERQITAEAAPATTMSSGTKARVWVSALLGLSLLTFLVAHIAPAAAVFYAMSALVLFALPGIPVGMALFGRAFLARPESLIFGSVIGIAMSGYVALASGYLWGWSAGRTTIFILVLTVVMAVLTRRKWDAPMVSLPGEWQASDYALLLGMGVLLLAFVSVPLMNVGRLTSEGYGYTWLFGFDFLLRSAIAASITHGLPPDYLHLVGNPLRYYLVAYTLPAFAYSISGKAISLHPILLLVQLGINFLFLACLFAYVRHFVRNRQAQACALFLVLVSYSYYGLYVLAKQMPQEFLARWAPFLARSGDLQFGDVSHLYQRLFLVEPQALFGLCIFLLTMLLLASVEYRLESLSLAVLVGLLFGIEFGVESWQGLALALWFGLAMLVGWMRQRRRVRTEFLPVLTVVLVTTAVYASFFLLGMYEFSSGRALIVRPYWWVMKFSPVYFPVEYGPLAVLGAIGFWRHARREKSASTMPHLVLLVLILLQIFFLTARVLPEFGLLRGNRLLPLLLVVWAGYWFDEILRRGAPRWARVATVAAIVLAVPTFFTDIFYTSNVDDRENTHYVRPADREACEWIRRNLPEHAIVQSEPDYVGHLGVVPQHRPIETSLIANFAERPMVLGEAWISATIIVDSGSVAKARRKDITYMLKATEVQPVLDVVGKYKIDYLYVGPFEQQLYPQLRTVLESSPGCFTPVYDKDGVEIFHHNQGCRVPVTTTQRAGGL